MPEIHGSASLPSSAVALTVELQAGVRYYFEVEGTDTGAGTMPDPEVELWSMYYAPVVDQWLTGSLLRSNNDGGVGRNARLFYTPGDTSYFQVVADGHAGSIGSFRMRVFEDDFRNSIEGVGIVGPHGGTAPLRGSLSYLGDTDFYRSTLIGGLTYTIDMRGQDSGDGTLADPYLRLYSLSGALLGYDDDAGAGSNALLTFTAPATAQYWIEGRAFSDNYVGSFKLDVGQGVGTALADAVLGAALADAVNGAKGDDTIRGEAGNDLLLGGQGNDLLIGGTGSDTLRGQAGEDTLEATGGADLLIGGLGKDTFLFGEGTSTPASRTRIGPGDAAAALEGVGAAEGDRIDLRAIDADATLADDQAFTFGSPGKGHLWVTDVGTDSVVRGNTDADGAIEFEFLIADGIVLASEYDATDFYL